MQNNSTQVSLCLQRTTLVKTIITHNGTFHADEITAIALLQIFTKDRYSITRVPHQSELKRADFTIDIGKILDPSLGLFDHHQYELGLSSAGLIWLYLGLTTDYPEISKLVALVDQNDVGIRKALSHEYSRIIGSYNTSCTNNDSLQQIAFIQAIEVAVRVIRSMKDAQDLSYETEKLITAAFLNRTFLAIEKGIVVVPKYLVGWDKFLNGQSTPKIRAIVWPKDEHIPEGEWNAQVIPTLSGEYGLHGTRFEQSDKMTFVHANGFFCVAPDKNTMLAYLAQ